MTVPGAEQIFNAILDLPLKEALTYLTASKIIDYSEKGYHKIKKLIQDKQNEGRYAFIPNKEEARVLNQLSSNPEYKVVGRLVPDYPYIDLIRTGLLIKKYHDTDSQRDRERVKEIKINIKRRPNGAKLLKIANLPTTPYFSVIIQHMFTLKLKDYPDNLLQEKFDEMIDTWETSAMLVESVDNEKKIVSFCDKQIEQDKPQFFILGMKYAASIVEETIKKLVQEEYFKKRRYDYKVNKSEEGSQPRVEITIFREDNN